MNQSSINYLVLCLSIIIFLYFVYILIKRETYNTNIPITYSLQSNNVCINSLDYKMGRWNTGNSDCIIGKEKTHGTCKNLALAYCQSGVSNRHKSCENFPVSNNIQKCISPRKNLNKYCKDGKPVPNSKLNKRYCVKSGKCINKATWDASWPDTKFSYGNGNESCYAWVSGSKKYSSCKNLAKAYCQSGKSERSHKCRDSQSGNIQKCLGITPPSTTHPPSIQLISNSNNPKLIV